VATGRMALYDHLRKLGVDDDFLREGVELLVQLLMELEVEEHVGADRYERSPERTTYRNGYRPRSWETRVGELGLRIPKVRQGTYFPSFLEPRRPAEQALLAVVQTAYVKGVSTRKVDDLLSALGLTGIDKSKVSRICRELDEQVTAFRNRPLEHAYPYVWLDALYLKVRQDHRIVNRALVVAIGVRESGEREVLGFALGASEEEAFWTEFLRSLVTRGLKGVMLVISDDHKGLKAAQAKVLQGAAWQRCRVHFMRNVLAHVPKTAKSMVAAALRMVFAQLDRQKAGAQCAEVVQALRARWPQAAEVLAAAEDDVLAYMAFPQAHWSRIYSTNPLERVHKEVRRRTNVVGVFPDDPSVIRLAGTVLQEIDDEWQLDRRYFSHESMALLYRTEAELREVPAPFTLAPIR
jgi:putative transposase